MGTEHGFRLTATLWRWQTPKAPASWYFLTIDGQTAAEIRYAALGQTGGFGSIRVAARIGGTGWTTSLFPHRESGGFILPVKAAVRKTEAIGEGDAVELELRIQGPDPNPPAGRAARGAPPANVRRFGAETASAPSHAAPHAPAGSNPSRDARW